MIGDKSILAVVPARGGSKGLPGKNIRLFHDKPLISWTVDMAKQSIYIDRVVVSSDDRDILMIAKQHGSEVPLKRPEVLAKDETPGVDAVIHAIESLPGYDYVVLLQPTSPLRKIEDIDNTIAMCYEKQAPACVSVTPANESPYWMYTMGDDQQLTSLVSEKSYTRRQDLPPVFRLNGAIYVADSMRLQNRRSFLMPDTIAYAMPAERSIDIDDAEDFRQAEALFQC